MASATVHKISDGRQQFDRATKDLRFAKDFLTSLEKIMDDPLATHAERILAFAKRYAWGNYSLFCIDEKTGAPLYQVDFARRLRIDPRCVSTTVRYLRKRGHLEPGGKLIYPCIDPSLGGPPDSNCKIDEKSQEYMTFLEEWKVAYSSDFCELEVARSTVKRIGKVVLSDYKKWRAARKTGPPVIITESSEIHESRTSLSPTPPSQPTIPLEKKSVESIKNAEPEPEPEGMSESRMQDTLKVFADHGRPLAPERIPEFRKAWNRLTPAIQERAFRDVSSKAGRLWKGSAFTPAPLKYLKDRGWEDPYVDKAAAAQSGNAAMARVREKYLGAEKG